MDFFSASRRLCQGNLISPLLFILVMEVLSRMLSTASQPGLFAGVSVGSSDLMRLEISNLLFAGDIIIFCDNDCEQIINLRRVLIWFESISG